MKSTASRIASTFLATMVALAALLVAPCPADELDELNARMTAIEQRLASLEESLKPLIDKSQAEQRLASQQALARKRMQQDSAVYSPADLREIESLYQVANKKWGTQQAQDSLQKLVEKYGEANRTGCAILYLGQMSSGDNKIKHLKTAIERFSECYYGDGVQVGAYARFVLGHTYLESHNPQQAKQLFDEIREDYPDSIDHRGNSLVAMLPD